MRALDFSDRLSALIAGLTSLAHALVSHALIVVSAALAVGLIVVQRLARRREERRARAALADAVRQKLDVPATLHPVIDPDVCIGSGSCLTACPEGKILGFIDGKARLINASKCIGHGRCAAECPVQAIRLVFGTAERGVDLPEVDKGFETARPGVHAVGELAGMGLIRNAFVQGLQLAAALQQRLAAGRPSREGVVDIAIVGAGPAGLAVALGARAAGLSFVVLEQGTMGGAVAHYPRHKIVMTEAVDLPYVGKFGRPLMSKEDLIAGFRHIVARGRIEVCEGRKVTAIDGRVDDFVVATTRGVVRARRVVLAIGRRGTPRRLGVPGEDLPKVTYGLIDPEQYHDRRVLVVGGGDAALEAAIQLARESSATVSLAYRGPALGRCRPANKARFDELVAAGRVQASMATEVLAVRKDALLLKAEGAEITLPNDFVIACLGGELPTEFLKAAGVSIRRHHGDKAMPNPALANRADANAGGGRWAALGLALLGVAIIAVLVMVGQDYYLLPRALRYRDARHALLKPSGAWGHGVGIVATTLMLSNFAYSARKRLKVLKRRGPIGPWLRFHVFVGVMSPLAILFHSAWQWGNHLATATYLALILVIATGLIGRFLFGLVRFDPKMVERATGLRATLAPFIERLCAPVSSDEAATLAPLLLVVRDPMTVPMSLAESIRRIPGDALRIRRALGRARSLLLPRAAYPAFRASVLELCRFELRWRCHGPLKKVMTAWRAIHVATALFLVALIGLHVWISLRVGFRWPGS
jgi:thioredoxin reductase/ferredoxin